MRNSQTINKDILIDELIRKYPEVCEVLEKFGMNCRECVLAPTSTLENAAEMHNVPLRTLLNEINKLLSQKK